MAKRKYPTFVASRNESLLDRLHRRSAKLANGCLLWTGAVGGRHRDRGRLTYRGQWMQAHVASWVAAYGPVPAGMMVCHTCDNGLCIEPTHLYVGTAKNNSTDMVDRGRSCAGIKHGMAKLSDREVDEIRSEPKTYGSGRRLAAKYRVSPAMICLIRQRKNWRHR